MSLQYAELARTPSGALTAASKRALEAERRQQQLQMSINWTRNQAFNDAKAELVAASDKLDREHPTEKLNPLTDREQRIYDDGYEEGKKDGRDAALDEADGSLYHLIHDTIWKLQLGLDSDLTPLQVLHKMREKVGE